MAAVFVLCHRAAWSVIVLPLAIGSKSVTITLVTGTLIHEMNMFVRAHNPIAVLEFAQNSHNSKIRLEAEGGRTTLATGGTPLFR